MIISSTCYVHPPVKYIGSFFTSFWPLLKSYFLRDEFLWPPYWKLKPPLTSFTTLCCPYLPILLYFLHSVYDLLTCYIYTRLLHKNLIYKNLLLYFCSYYLPNMNIDKLTFFFPSQFSVLYMIKHQVDGQWNNARPCTGCTDLTKGMGPE